MPNPVSSKIRSPVVAAAMLVTVTATAAPSPDPRTVRGEVIEITAPPPVLPKPQQDPMRTPPYSDDAILTNQWARAWVLLDIDANGKVTRIKMLKAPGLGLDGIAQRESFKRTFEPARDHAGQPVGTMLILGLEWPSYWWLIAREGRTTHVPAYQHPDGLRAMVSKVPCIGEAPMNLSLRAPTQRDCSRPDIKKASTVPWLYPR